MDRWHSRLPVWHGSHPISAEPASPGCRQRVVVEALDELRPATHSPGLNAPQPDAGLEPEFLFEPGILSRHEGVSVEFAIGQKTYACVTIPLRSFFSWKNKPKAGQRAVDICLRPIGCPEMIVKQAQLHSAKVVLEADTQVPSAGCVPTLARGGLRPLAKTEVVTTK